MQFSKQTQDALLKWVNETVHQIHRKKAGCSPYPSPSIPRHITHDTPPNPLQPPASPSSTISPSWQHVFLDPVPSSALTTPLPLSPTSPDAPLSSSLSEVSEGSRLTPVLNTQINDGFPVSKPAETLADLADGSVLAEVVQDIDPSYDAADIDRQPPEYAEKWSAQKRNMLAIHKALSRFVHRRCPDLEYLFNATDLAALHAELSPEGIAKLVSVMIAICFLGPDPAKYVLRLQEPGRFDEQTMREIQRIIVEKQNEGDAVREDAQRALEQAPRDADLELEERHARLVAQYEVSRKQSADLLTRFEHLQETYEELKVTEGKHFRELEILRKATQDGASDSQVIKRLEAKIREQDELITNQESQADDDRTTKNRLQHQVAALTEKAERLEALDDEVAELKHKNAELARKANAAERLRQKLEQQKDLEREVQNLRFEKEELSIKGGAYDKLLERISILERSLHEVQLSHSSAEETIYLLSNQKRMLEESNRRLVEEINALRDQRNQDERVIAELQENPSSPTPLTGAGVSLEEELEGESRPAAPAADNTALEVGRLRAENSLLRRDVGSGESSRLRAELEEARRNYTELQGRYTEMVEQNAVGQDYIAAILSDAAGEGTRAFEHMRAQTAQKEDELKREKQRADEYKALLNDRDRELLIARAEMTEEQREATQELFKSSLRDELLAERDRNRTMAAEHEIQRSQLIEAFIAKDKLRKELDELRGGKPADTAADDGKVSEEVLAKTADKTTEKIEKLRERIRERQQQIEQLEKEKYELQLKLKASGSGGLSASQKATYEQSIKNLQKENALIASAWYDLTSRMQSNHLVLQRRNDAPKSWLNKQRHLVNATPRR